MVNQRTARIVPSDTVVDAVRLSLARRGHDLVAAVTGRRRMEIAELLEAIPAEQQGVLVDALGFLTAAAGELPEQDWSTGWDL